MDTNILVYAKIRPPIPVSFVMRDLRRILDAPCLVLLQETPNHQDVMFSVIEDSGVSGNLIDDSHIAALCLEHGITELISGDRDFTRFSSLNVRNPFVEKERL